MQNLVVTDTCVRETLILQTGISLIKNIYQSEVFSFICESVYKLLVPEISPGNVIIMLTHQILIILVLENLSFLKKPASLETGAGMTWIYCT